MNAFIIYFFFREEESRTFSDSTDNVYRYGVSVKTRGGILALPQPTLAGQCMYTAPVRYLKDMDHSCTYTISESLCSGSSVLSALSYINTEILEGGSSVVVAPTNFVYRCATQPYLQSYLKSTQVLSEIVNKTQVYKFDYSLPADPNCVDVCGNDKCIDLNNLTDADVDPGMPPECIFSSPPTPVVSSGSCINSVIDVDYTIKWSGNKIARLDAVIIIANISLQNSAGTGYNVLTQKYKTTFEHNVTTVGNGSTDNFNNITNEPYERSGRVGYNIGKAVFTGSEVINTSVTPAEFMYVNTNFSRQMAVFDTSK